MSEPEFIYDAIAAEYAKCVEDNVWNAHYERANSLRLVGEVAGRSVLDAGCGPGAHAAAGRAPMRLRSPIAEPESRGSTEAQRYSGSRPAGSATVQGWSEGI